MANFITADIHGNFSGLWARLESLGFKPQRDTLYALGDLVNRGQESRYVTEWLQKPWFKAIRGNHEAMIIEAWQNPQNEENLNLLRSVNGAWWFDLSSAAQEKVANNLMSLPYCRDLTVAGQQLGFIHADAPESTTWLDYKTDLEAGDASSIEMALWARGRWRDGVSRNVPTDYMPNVKGLDWLFVGHSPVDKPTVVGNVVFCDCGLWRGNTAGVFCLDDWVAAQSG